ncbi:hypothetical protein KMW28_27215 [Flammeovirga yaeyamensis]|uniref:Uncharacterized protein n=1 Tax=Flammeovirga yaeyamensis TaxID=367791 RepID=A0AAX1NAN8_9BACT|nr:hypothetical protein [Flammeovirga yaeyamensis]MBB3700029.1 hypothetical protein [Flammeovirga yaeyamensis]NMF37534.1 hypothetical protein [Flammeovirga yaeyamensis]QWG04591.1 hypothetical protein KMW28_27215 [Flammeovirga yaeyamensis]
MFRSQRLKFERSELELKYQEKYPQMEVLGFIAKNGDTYGVVRHKKLNITKESLVSNMLKFKYPFRYEELEVEYDNLVQRALEIWPNVEFIRRYTEKRKTYFEFQHKQLGIVKTTNKAAIEKDFYLFYNEEKLDEYTKFFQQYEQDNEHIKFRGFIDVGVEYVRLYHNLLKLEKKCRSVKVKNGEFPFRYEMNAYNCDQVGKAAELRYPNLEYRGIDRTNKQMMARVYNTLLDIEKSTYIDGLAANDYPFASEEALHFNTIAAKAYAEQHEDVEFVQMVSATQIEFHSTLLNLNVVVTPYQIKGEKLLTDIFWYQKVEHRYDSVLADFLSENPHIKFIEFNYYRGQKCARFKHLKLDIVKNFGMYKLERGVYPFTYEEGLNGRTKDQCYYNPDIYQEMYLRKVSINGNDYLKIGVSNNTEKRSYKNGSTCATLNTFPSTMATAGLYEQLIWETTKWVGEKSLENGNTELFEFDSFIEQHAPNCDSMEALLQLFKDHYGSDNKRNWKSSKNGYMLQPDGSYKHEYAIEGRPMKPFYK